MKTSVFRRNFSQVMETGLEMVLLVTNGYVDLDSNKAINCVPSPHWMIVFHPSPLPPTDSGATSKYEPCGVWWAVLSEFQLQKRNEKV